MNTLLYKYTDHYGVVLTAERTRRGTYELSLSHGFPITIELPSAKVDELRVTLMAGFSPARDNPNQIALAIEPPHPDD